MKGFAASHIPQNDCLSFLISEEVQSSPVVYHRIRKIKTMAKYDKSKLPAKISALPNAPGCYIFWDSAGEILYVGKSKRVRNRVRSYFGKNNLPKINKLAKLIAHIECRPALDEIDALYLEHSLIKTYRPPFNAQMKKDPVFHYICIEWGCNVPGLYISDKPGPEATRYGSFFSAYDARDALGLLNKIWGTPVCENRKFDFDKSKASRSCLRLHIDRCLGPCEAEGREQEAEYRKELVSVAAFMQGSNKQALSDIKLEMEQAALDLDFEKAAGLRDIFTGLLGLWRRVRYRMPFAGRRLCIFVKGYNEPNVLLLYYRKGQLKHTVRCAESIDWANARDSFISVITGEAKTDDNLPDLVKIYTSTATQEIRAKKLCVDVTKTRKTSLAGKLDRAFAKMR